MALINSLNVLKKLFPTFDSVKQSIDDGIKNEVKRSNEAYWKNTVTNRMNVTLRDGWYPAENPLSITKRTDIVTLSGAVYHGKDGAYQVIGKVPTGYEPTDETFLTACYLKDDSSFANIAVVITVAGEIIQLGLRLNNDKTKTKTIISGTWQCVGGI